MRYGVVDWRLVLGERSDFGAKGKVACGRCVGFSVVFDGRLSAGRDARMAHGMLKRPTCLLSSDVVFMSSCIDGLRFPKLRVKSDLIRSDFGSMTYGRNNNPTSTKQT